MNFFQIVSEWAAKNPGKTVGALAGFIAGLLIFTVGIIGTIIIAILALVGFVIGKSKDDNKSVIDEITGLFKREKRDDDMDM